MPKLINLANRTKELELFLKMAQGNHDCRILLIEGDPGMGKSSLLNKFRDECPKSVKYIPFDCKGLESISAFLSEVVDYLGNHQFPTFIKQLETFTTGGVDFSKNDIKGNVSIIINTDTIAKDFRLQKLEKAFFEDLEKLEHQIVITLDTYQLGNPALQDWIESKWLRNVEQRLKNVVTVIAGQIIPSPNHSVWGYKCKHFLLTSINDSNAWCEFFSELPKDAVKAIALSANGHPSNVHQMLLLMVDKW